MMQHNCNGPVLIVEDDPNTAALVQTYLERDGFQTIKAADGETALRLARQHRPGFVILDIMLPRLDGWEVCRQLRTFSAVPILMLTAREEEIDRVAGLVLGADDYLVKPFSPRELVARVKAILRRVHPGESDYRELLICNELVVEPEKHRVRLGDSPVNLTGSEYKLLCALMRAPGRVFSRSELLSHFYQDGETVVDRVIDVHIGNLRQKIERDPAKPQFIITVRGFGYKFSECEEQ